MGVCLIMFKTANASLREQGAICFFSLKEQGANVV